MRTRGDGEGAQGYIVEEETMLIYLARLAKNLHVGSVDIQAPRLLRRSGGGVLLPSSHGHHRRDRENGNDQRARGGEAGA